MQEFVSAVEESLKEDEGIPPEEQFVEFKLDGREMKAYPLTSGQLAFMMAAMGRGQTSDQRLAAIINLILESLRDDDRDYMESRLLTRDAERRLSMETLESVFEYLIGEWFGRPTQSASDSGGYSEADGQKSKPRTTKQTSSD